MKRPDWFAGMLAGLLIAAAPQVAAQAPAAKAQAHPKPALELARRLVARSGLAEQLKSLPKQMEQELAQSRGALPDALVAALGEAAKESFRPSALQDDVTHSLAASLPAEDMKRALEWLETAAGRRVTRAEELAASTLTPEAVQAYAARAQSAPPSPQRVKLIGDLIAVTKAVESSAAIMEGMALGVAMGVDSAQPVQKRIGLAVLQKRLRAAMPPEKVREAMSAALPAMYGYTYREVSEADLSAYLQFNRSAHGARYNDAVIAALTEALARASLRMGPSIEKALQKRPA